MHLWCRSISVCVSNMRKFLCMKSFYREQKILLVFQIVHLVFLCSPNCSGYAFQCWFSWLCNLSGLLSHLPWMWFRSQSPLDLSCFAISLVFYCYPFIMVVYLVFWILNALLLELIPQQLPNALLQLVFYFPCDELTRNNSGENSYPYPQVHDRRNENWDWLGCKNLQLLITR